MSLTSKNITPNTDAPNADEPNATYHDAADGPNDADDEISYPKLIQLSLRNHNHKIAPNTKKQ